MNPFVQKLFHTREGKKFLAFLVIFIGFWYSVIMGASRVSWQDFVDYVRNVTNDSLQKTVDQSSDFVSVKRVVDGDTIELEDGRKVRYIGVNTPESVKVNSPAECFGKEASAKNKELVEGKSVRLEKDVSEADRYGRLLRFVYLEDGTFVNDELVRAGYARVSTFPPDVKLAEQFKQAEREARENKRGIWADETCAGKR
ncbi:MAG: thermonuclease family protein [Candidatus Moranbacteria bacterium]|nr:thermonuclease family protein [Candidatus Moranbacteria bacterium]